jgi:hypothetical protein
MKKDEETPKVVEVVENWDRKGTYNRIMADRERKIQDALSKCTVVPMRTSQDPHVKLLERVSTYKNVRKMRTDYKNYIRKYGQPEFGVPSEISGN